MSLLRKGIIASSGSLVCAVLGMTGNVMLSRTLLPEGMGRYQLPLTAGMLAMTILSLGVGQSNIFLLNRHRIPIQQIMINSLWFSATGSLLLIIFTPSLLTVFAGYFGVLPMWTKIILGIDASSLFCFYLLRPILIAGLQIRRDTVAQIAQRASICLLIAIGIVCGIITVPIALSITCIGDLLALGMVVYYLREHIQLSTKFAWKIFRQTLVYGLKIFAANFVYIVNTSIGLLLLRYLIANDFAMVGNYGRAAALSGFVMLVPTAVGPLLYAKWSDAQTDQRGGQVALAMRLHLVLAGIIIPVLALFAPWFVRILYGIEFMPAAEALHILAFGVGLRCLFNVCHNLLTSDGHAHFTAYIYGISVVITGFCTWWLVPHYGIRGPALADVIASSFVLICGIIIMKVKYGFCITNMFLPNISDIKHFRTAISSTRR